MEFWREWGDGVAYLAEAIGMEIRNGERGTVLFVVEVAETWNEAA